MADSGSKQEKPVRAAVILIEEGHLCLIRRERAGATYYLFPGGHTEDGETPRQAAQREALEELGLHVHIDRLLARAHHAGQEQHYYLARSTGGTFGTGTGAELTDTPDAPGGSHTPTWVPLHEAQHLDTRPKQLCAALANHVSATLLGAVLEIDETNT